MMEPIRSGTSYLPIPPSYFVPRLLRILTLYFSFGLVSRNRNPARCHLATASSASRPPPVRQQEKVRPSTSSISFQASFRRRPSLCFMCCAVRLACRKKQHSSNSWLVVKPSSRHQSYSQPAFNQSFRLNISYLPFSSSRPFYYPLFLFLLFLFPLFFYFLLFFCSSMSHSP